MDNKLFIPVLLGTVRKNSVSEKVANLLFKRAGQREDFDTKLLDPRTMELPMDDESDDFGNKNPEYKDAIIKADGLIIVAPEYNHGYSGSLKRTLDILYPEYKHKAVAFAGVSSGIFAGARAVEQLVGVTRKLGMSAIQIDLPFPTAGEKFDEQGNLLDDAYLPRIQKFFDEIVWLSKAMKWGRENI